MPSNLSKKQFINKVIPVDLRISARNDAPVHSKFNYVVTESIIHNLRYALIWDSLRPELHDDNQADDADEPDSAFLSFRKVKNIASNFVFLIQKGRQLIQLYDITSKREVEPHQSDSGQDNESGLIILKKNTNLVTEDCMIMLIPRHEVKQRLNCQNFDEKQKLPVPQQVQLTPQQEQNHYNPEDHMSCPSVSNIESNQDEVTLYPVHNLDSDTLNSHLLMKTSDNKIGAEQDSYYSQSVHSAHFPNHITFDQILYNSQQSSHKKHTRDIDIGSNDIKCKQEDELTLGANEDQQEIDKESGEISNVDYTYQPKIDNDQFNKYADIYHSQNKNLQSAQTKQPALNYEKPQPKLSPIQLKQKIKSIVQNPYDFQYQNESEIHLESSSKHEKGQTQDDLQNILMQRASGSITRMTTIRPISKDPRAKTNNRSDSLINNHQISNISIIQQQAIKDIRQRMTLAETSTSASSSTKLQCPPILKTYNAGNYSNISNKDSIMRVKQQQSIRQSSFKQINSYDEQILARREEQLIVSVRKSVMSHKKDNLVNDKEYEQPLRTSVSQCSDNYSHSNNSIKKNKLNHLNKRKQKRSDKLAKKAKVSIEKSRIDQDVLNKIKPNISKSSNNYNTLKKNNSRVVHDDRNEQNHISIRKSAIEYEVCDRNIKQIQSKVKFSQSDNNTSSSWSKFNKKKKSVKCGKIGKITTSQQSDNIEDQRQNANKKQKIEQTQTQNQQGLITSYMSSNSKQNGHLEHAKKQKSFVIAPNDKKFADGVNQLGELLEFQRNEQKQKQHDQVLTPGGSEQDSNLISKKQSNINRSKSYHTQTNNGHMKNVKHQSHQNKKDVEMYEDKGQFKQCAVKEYLDQFMPNKPGFKVFLTQRDLQYEIVEPINKLHHHDQNSAEKDEHGKYFIHFTEKYAQLKCCHRQDNGKGKECLFRYWFKFEQDDAGNHKNFELFRLINSNHSLPMH